jgi:carbon-monoxide dehydrogenase medium subunit
VLSAVGPKSVTSSEAESALRGNALSKDNLEKAAEAIIAASDPQSDSRGSAAFKRTMLHSLFIKAADIAISRARGNQITGAHEYV